MTRFNCNELPQTSTWTQLHDLFLLSVTQPNNTSRMAATQLVMYAQHIFPYMNSPEFYLCPRSNARSRGNSTGPAATQLAVYGQHNFHIQTRWNFDQSACSLPRTIFSASNTTAAENFTTISSWTHLARTHAPHLDDLLHTPPEIFTVPRLGTTLSATLIYLHHLVDGISPPSPSCRSAK